MSRPDSTTDPKVDQPTYLQNSRTDWSALYSFLDCCPHAQTMVAYDLDRDDRLIYALPCNQWSCRHCARRKTRFLAFQTERAKPNRLATLTVDPKLYANPRVAFDRTRRKVPEWVRAMRVRFGELEYLRVTELHKSGYPHYHLLIRSNYIPHPVARDEWQSLTGAVIIDIRQVKKTFSCYTYLLKYLTKMHRIEWTGRHVSYSRDFFPPPEETDYVTHELAEKKVYREHPATHIMDYGPTAIVHRITPRSFLLETGPDPPADPPRQSTFEDPPHPPPDETPQNACFNPPLGPWVPGGYWERFRAGKATSMPHGDGKPLPHGT